MSKEDYWFPWFPVHFKRDTMHLSLEHDGMYRRLIDYYMETGMPIPSDDLSLSRIVTCGLDEWKMAAAILRPFFSEQNGRLHHKKCDEILLDQRSRSLKQAQKGKKGAASRWSEKQRKNSSGYARALAQAMPGDSTRQDNIKEKILKEKTLFDKFEEFWKLFPKTRAGSQEKARAAYLNALNRDPEYKIIEGVKAYRNSEEVARGYAKGAAAWLNDDRWKNDYSPPKAKAAASRPTEKREGATIL